MFSEQFIQDTICQPKRLVRLLGDIGKAWQFYDGEDIICQEVCFEAGRLDVLATFNRREHLVIVESKLGTAGLADLMQLQNYLDNWRKLPLESMNLQRVNDVLGFLLAEQFIDIPALQANVSLVRFELSPGQFPFRVIQPAETLRSRDEEIVTRITKSSQLVTVDDHLTRIKDCTTRDQFKTLASCFLEPNDARKEWLFQNAKGDHLAIHYKGQYIMDLWPRGRYYLVGYNLGGQRVSKKGPDGISEDELKADVAKLLQGVDLAMDRHIGDFRWSDC